MLHLRIQLPEELESGKEVRRRGGKEGKRGKKERGEEEEEEEEEEEGEEEEEEEEQKKGRGGQERADSSTEYVAASPRFTWTDEHVRCAKQERFGELLWPIVLRTYGFTEEIVSPVFGTYKAFLGSRFYLHSERYPHHSLRGLMEWYVEENLLILRKGNIRAEEWEDMKRRKLLRSLFLKRNLTWSGEYLDVYREWARTHGAGLNRYRKMEHFLETFFGA